MAFHTRFIRNIILVAGQQGANLQDLADPIAMTLEEMNAPDQTVPYQAYNRMLELAYEQTGNPHLGISVSRELNLSTAGIVLQLMQSSATIREGLQQACNFYQLGCSSLPMELRGNTLDISYDPLWREDSELAYQQTLEGALHFLLRSFSTFTQGRQVPDRITLDYTVSDWEALEKHYGCIVVPGTQTTMQFSSQVLDRTIDTSDYTMLTHLVQFAQQKLNARLQEHSWSEKVKNTLLHRLPESPDLEEIAQSLGTSTRSLQRHLRKEGQSFRRLNESIKLEFAQLRLSRKEASVKELAYLLGYSETSAFSRAFRRHYGYSPRQVQSAV